MTKIKLIFLKLLLKIIFIHNKYVLKEYSNFYHKVRHQIELINYPINKKLKL